MRAREHRTHDSSTHTPRRAGHGCRGWRGACTVTPQRVVLLAVRRAHDTRWLLSLLAVLALLQPLMVPFAPDLEGWSPLHSHVYRAGVPVPHTHPWEQPQRLPTSNVICNLHGAPHEVPASSPTTRASATEHDASQQSVGFTSDGPGGTSAIAIAPTGPMPACPEAVTTATADEAAAPLSLVSSPAPPPPRA